MVKNQKLKENLALIVLICILFFLPFLVNPQIITTRNNDLGRTYIPIISFIRDSFYKSKQIPLWRPDQLMGESFVSNPISSVFYPANIFFLTPPHYAAVIYLLFHYILAGISTFFLARSFKLPPAASTVAAIFYTFSFKIAVHLEAGHLTMIAAASLLPLAFLAIRNLLKTFSTGWLITGSLSLTFMYFTYPTIFYYCAIFLTLYWFYNRAFHGKKPSLLKFLQSHAPFLILMLTTLGTAAIVLLPHLEFGHASTRSYLTLTDVANPIWNLRRFVLSLIFPYPILKDLSHEAFLYLGVAPTLLAALGFLKLKIGQKITLLVSGTLTLAFVAGTSTPLFEIAYDWLPLFKYLRVTTRLWFIIALIIALSAAFKVSQLKSKRIIYLALAVFTIEFLYITYTRIGSIPTLPFGNEKIYEFLASDPDLSRVYCTTHCLNPQLVSKYRLQILDGENPIADANFVQFLEKAGNYNWDQFAVIFPPYQVWQTANPPTPNAQILGKANVKYVASTYPLTDDNFTLVDIFDGTYLYQNKLFQKRAYFEPDSDEIKINKYSPNVIDLSFIPEPTIRKLVISDNYFPGWTAKINQEKHQVLPTAFQSRLVIVPPNTQNLELKFSPKNFELGKTITITTLIILGMWYIRTKSHV